MATITEIFVLPQHSITIGKDGGPVVITAFYPETKPDGSDNVRVLNDELIETINFDAPYVQYKGRERVNDQTVRYTFVFEKNDSGAEREKVAAVISDTSTRPYGFGWFSIRQTAE